jgi:site-specific recombinase XerD
MKATRTRHGYMADLSYLRNAFGPICDVLKPRRRCNRTPQDSADVQRHDPVIRAAYLEHVTTAQLSDFSRALRAILDAYARPVVSGPWFFPSPRGKRWDPDNFSQALRKINRAAGLPWSCLTFRQTFGSLLAMKGESLYKISALMGNSPEICRRHYAMLMPEALAQSVEFESDFAG